MHEALKNRGVWASEPGKGGIMPKRLIGRLQRAIFKLHGVVTTWAESVPVREEWEGRVVWDGVVEVFDLVNHPTVTRCYAWRHETNDGKMRIVTVLHAPPVDSPQAAVRASIVAEFKKKGGGAG